MNKWNASGFIPILYFSYGVVGIEIYAKPVLFIGVHRTFFCEVAAY